MNPGRRADYLRSLQRFGVKLGLHNIRAVLSALGEPQRKFPAVHVAGTNGKGSVCAMLASILREQGFTAGLYTSPHLVDVRERIRVDGRLIPGRDFDRLLGRIRRTIDRLLAEGRLEAHPTYFEVLTILAFLHFSERNVDIAVLEVGMGGRFDATNVIVPLLSVITSISLDHCEYLGRTPAAIAAEKAGIIKPGVPVVCGVGEGGPKSVIRRRAAELGAPFLSVLGRDGRLRASKTAAGFHFRYDFCGEAFVLRPRLPGAHQGANAAVAVAAARTLGCVWRPFDHRAIERGITRADWPGRLETVARRPRLILDGAHNEEGARALAAYVRAFVRRPLVLVFAMMKDKAVSQSAKILFPLARRVVLPSIPFARAATPDEVRALARPFRHKIVVEPDLRRAVALAKREAGPRGTVLVAGSLYLIGEFKKIRPRF